MNAKIRLARKTAAEWAALNPTLLNGQPGYETDTNKLKVGNGTSAWNDLGYIGIEGFTNWGEIGGDLSDQTDLQTALDTKAADADLQTEITDRSSADSTLQSNIDDEATTRTSADDDLQTQIDAKQSTSEKNQNNGYAGLDSSGKLSSSQLPDIAVVDYLGSVASQAAMLALTGQKGDWCTRSDSGTNFIISGSDPTLIGSWTQLTYPTAPVISVAGKTGAVTLDKNDVGLSNVPNTDATNPANISQTSSYRFVTDTEKSTWNGKQDALGYTAENVANKDTDTTLAANSDTKYASQKATKTYADTKATKATSPTNGHIGGVDGSGNLTDTGKTFDTDGTLASNSDSKIATQKATKTYADTKVTGVSSSTDNAVIRWDGTGGHTAQDSGMTVDDSGAPNIPAGQVYKIGGVSTFPIYVNKTTITDTQVKALNGTPQTVLAALGSNKIPLVMGFLAYISNSGGQPTAYTTNTVLLLQSNGSTAGVNNIISDGSILGSTAARYSYRSASNPVFSSSSATNMIPNSALQVTVANGNPGGGNANNSLTIWVFYSVMDVTA